MKVIIDGVRYVPAHESNKDFREVVAREVSDLFWGELGDDWEAQFALHLGSLTLSVRENITARLASKEQ